MIEHPRWIIHDRHQAVAKLHAALASELGIAVVDGVVDPREHWRVLHAAAERYEDWCRRAEGKTRPVMRGKVDVALSNLHGIDYQPAF